MRRLAVFLFLLAALLGLGTPQTAQAACNDVAITDQQLFGPMRLGPTVWRLFVRPSVTNSGAEVAIDTTVSIVDMPPNVTPVLATASFGDVAPTATVATPGMIIIDVDRSSRSSFADIVFEVDCNEAPVADAGPDQTAFVTDTVTLDGSGSTDGDGDALSYSWTLTGPAGSTATLSDPNAVMPTFVVDVFGTYTAELVVNDGFVDSATDSVEITTDNTPPVADAGPDQTVLVTDMVTLDGTGSSDVDGQMLTFAWMLTPPAGSTASLSDPTAIMPTFVADLPGAYVVELIVNDGMDDSAPDSVTISTDNSAPVADAGLDQLVALGATVTLDGAGSSDVDMDLLTFDWSLMSVPPGSAAAISDPAAVQPTFVADLPGTYVAQLIVNDGTVPSAPDTVTITTLNTQPVADAGPDQTVFVTDLVTLDGSGSGDADGDPITFFWAFTNLPAGSSAVLADANTVSPSFTVDVPGMYVVELIVNDGTTDSLPDTIVIDTQNSAPVADAGPDQPGVPLGATVTLDGSGSGDADGDSLTFAWSFTSVPPGSLAMPSDPNAVGPTFVADEPGTYVAQLIVNDGTVPSAPDTVVITVDPAFMTLALENTELIGLGQTVNLIITLSVPAGTGGRLVDVSSDDPNTAAIAAPGQVTILEGETQALIGVDGVGLGDTTLRANSTGLAEASISVSVTLNIVSVDNVTLAPGETASLPLSLTQPAPPGGLTVTLTPAAPSIATVPASVLIPAGAQIPAANPQATGLVLGATFVTAMAPGFATGTATITVTITLSFADPTPSVIEGDSVPVTINLSSPAPAGGLTLDLSVDDPGIASVPATAFVPNGQTSVVFQLDGLVDGNTTLRASAPGITEVTAAVTVDPLPPIAIGARTVGENLQTTTGGTLGVPAPAGNLIVTLTSLEPSRLLLANGAADPGAASIQVQVNAGNSSLPLFRVQALDNTGTAQFSASAPGYSTSIGTVTMVPSGFILNTSNFTTTTLSDNRNIQVASVRLNPANLAFTQLQQVRGGLSFDVPVTSSLTGVGTITTSPVTMAGGSSTVNTQFDPGTTPGMTTISVSQPAGFATPSNFQSVVATVNEPSINVSPRTVGDDLQATTGGSLDAPAPALLTVTLTSLEPSRLLLANGPTDPGMASITVQVIPGSFGIPSFWLQALDDTGTVQVSASAPGFATGTGTVTLAPSGFIFNTSSILNTTTLSANSNVQVASARLNPANLAWAQNQQVRAGLMLDVPVMSSDPNVGTIITSPLTFMGGQSFLSTEFDPVDAGTTLLTLMQPAGFDAPSTFEMITANVTAPAITLGNRTIGDDLQVSTSGNLGAPAPALTNVTITSLEPSRLLLANSPTDPGSASIMVQVPQGSATIPTIRLFALDDSGTAQYTASASGFSTGTGTVTLVPSSFILNTAATIDTTTFSGNTVVQVTPARLNPANLGWQQNQPLRGGLSVDVGVMSSSPPVGTIVTSPLTFGPNVSFQNTEFDPVSPGMTTITLVQPAGFDVSTNFQSVLATVRAPNINLSDTAVGEDLQLGRQITLEALPPSPVDVIVTSNAPIIATISDDANVSPGTAGTNTITFPGVTTLSAGIIFVQGRSLGSTTVTVQAAGYNDGTGDVTVDPSGFILNTAATINTTVGAGNSNLGITPARLDPTTLNFGNNQFLRGGISVDIPVLSSDTMVGVITVSPVPFPGNDNLVVTQFDPLAVGTTTVTIQQPAGFDTPSNFQQVVVNVDP